MTNIFPIPAFKDNYIWALHSPGGSEIIVVDPGDAEPVFAYMKANHVSLHAILLTHHHWDHSGGIAQLRAEFPHSPVYASHFSAVSEVTQPVKMGDTLSFSEFDLHFTVLEIPGHTLDHIAYIIPGKMLFCGDTLFACGCGRLFEGTPQQMLSSLYLLKKQPKSTLIYCGHEYTLANIEFARQVEPENKLLQKRYHDVLLLRKQHHPSLPTSLEIELETNPFLRCNEQHVIQAVEAYVGQSLHNEVDVFAHLRQWKNAL